MLAILQVVFSILKTKHYSIQFFIMNVSANLRFLELIAEKGNWMPVIIATLLAKHSARITIERVSFHAKLCVSIEVLQYRRDSEPAYQFIESFLSCEVSDKRLLNFFLLCIFGQINERRSHLRKSFDKASIEFSETQKY